MTGLSIATLANKRIICELFNIKDDPLMDRLTLKPRTQFSVCPVQACRNGVVGGVGSGRETRGGVIKGWEGGEG